jgi:hypothetical protein
MGRFATLLAVACLGALGLAGTASPHIALADTPRAASPRAESPAFLVARPRVTSLSLRSRPGGSLVGRLGRRTQFGSEVTLAVVRRRGAWLSVVTTALPNGRLAWVRARDVRISHTRISLTLDLSRRALFLKRGDRVLRRMRVGVGRPGSPTPTGRFAVTDKLSGSAYGSYYGCCIVALSAHQPNLPPGWRGGDRIAVHGTNQPSTIGAAASAGCPHARDADLRVLMARVPLGAPVFIQA